MKTSIILVAAGKGERFGQPKWSVKLAGKTLLEWCLETIAKLEFEKEVIIVLPSVLSTKVEESDGWKEVENAVGRTKLRDSSTLVGMGKGGVTRHESVQAGLRKATGDLVIIHNVANPLASNSDFYHIQETLSERDAACFVGQKLVDTLRRVTDERSETIDRSDVWRVQTPQGFRRGTLQKAIENNKNREITDEVSLFEGTGIPIMSFETSASNQKVTYPFHIDHFEQELRQEVLVGVGEDSHFFDTSGTITIGGVQVEGLPKLKGNSDGDVILHALFNAISSALGQRSISLTADPMVEQGIVDSSRYLQVILETAHQGGFHLNNVSISLECAQPKIEPLVDRLKNSLSQLLTMNPERIGITATSGEGLSPFGKGEGIRCSCVLSLVRF